MKRRTFPRAACATLIASFLLTLAFFISPAASSQGRPAARQDVERTLESFDELTLDPASMLRDVRKTGRLTLDTSRGTFEMSLEPFDVRTDDYRSVAVEADGTVRELPREPSHAFKGTVVGMQGTQVRLILDGQQVEGIIVTPGENYFVEPERRLSPAAGVNDFVFYAASGVKQKDAGTCATTLAQKVGGAAARTQTERLTTSSKGPTTADAFSPKGQADVATEADFEFTQTFGGDATATNKDILNILTQVDAIYSQQLGISFNLNVVFQRAWTAKPANYPYTTVTAPASALEEFAGAYDKSFTDAGQTPPSRDLVHMFTGKDLDGSTIGISYIGAVCEFADSAFGISQSKFNGQNTAAALRTALTAHEIGHNFGATHTGPSSNPSDPPVQIPGCDVLGGAIMQPAISSNATGFCQFSIDEITDHTANFSDCLTRLAPSGCTYSLSSGFQAFPSGGGSGTVNLTTSLSSCGWTASEGSPWFAVTSGQSGTGSGTVSFFVDPNTNTGPRASSLDIGGQQLKIQQAASTNCPLTPIGPGQTLSGSLTSADCLSGQPDRLKAFADLYTFAGRAGQRVQLEMNAAVRASDTPDGQTPPAAALDTVLYLFGPDGSIVAFNDDLSATPHNTDSRIPVSGFFTLPQTGIYTVEASSFDNADDGAYTLRFSDDSATNTVALSGGAFSVNEGVGSNGLGTDGTGQRVISVTRAGDASGTATVDYATSNGTADKHGDYEQTLGTLVFAPGQTTRSFTVLVPDDRFAEQPETVNVTLSNPVGTTLGTPSAATLTVNDNDTASGPSPVRWDSNFNTGFFVRQQYLDFFSREPDSSGFQFWSADINNCGADDGCAQVHRVNTSAAFFLSIEFQETGYLVERTYKAAFGDATGNSTFNGAHTLAVPSVRLESFLADTQRIGQNVVVGVGNWQTQLEANKQAFALEFVMRPAFISAYPLTMTPAQFVDKLNQNAGGVLTQGERDALIAQVASNPDTAAGRAAALRAVAENPVLTANEKNRAFVLMQFFGYLRRNPNDAPDADYTGYDFWLTKLNQFGGDYASAEMVKAFVTSIEYTNRFGT
jgi:hypothetical protein